MLRGFCLLLLFAIQLLAKEQVPLTIQLLSERHRTEWNWVEYRLKITNTSTTSIINPDVYYFAENTEDSSLVLDVDYVTYFYSTKVESFITGAYNIFQIKLTGVLQPSQSLDIHFRIHKNNWSAWDCSKDFSYQQKSATPEPHYWVAVYDASKELLWGVDPVSGKRKSDVVLWYDRGGKSVIYPYSGDSTEILNPGRFWLLKETPLSSKERKLLKQNGVELLDIGIYQNKDLMLLISKDKIKKSFLKSILNSFFNAFEVNDTIAFRINLTENDKKKQILELEVSCWADIVLSKCQEIVLSCGGTNLNYDGNFVLTNIPTTSISCLEENADIEYALIVSKNQLTNNFVRKVIYVDDIQNDSIWKTALNAQYPNTEWLLNTNYSGEKIIVGVYDTGIYYDHLTFNEKDSSGNYISRKAGIPNEVVNGAGEADSSRKNHATHVAGIIGGNGWGSLDYAFRGVAPKISFFSSSMIIGNQIGHVANHSHTLKEQSNTFFYYGERNARLDNNIFFDWKKENIKSSEITNFLAGDSIKKTVVAAAGNQGIFAQYGKTIGLHSITFNAKNPIIVGNYSSITKKRNTHSSMGPTWDGRIKPDVMAPGTSVQYSFNTNSPFVVLLDYIELYHEKESNPYLKINFGENERILDSLALVDNCKHTDPNLLITCKLLREKKASNLSIMEDSLASNGKALRWEMTDSSASETYINWNRLLFSDSQMNILRNDIIKIRYRFLNQMTMFPFYHGNIYFSSGKDFYEKNNEENLYIHHPIDFPVSKNENYQIVSSIWENKNIQSNFFRIGFNFDIGVFSSIPCEKNMQNKCYYDAQGTSMAAPVVSGVIALMYQTYRRVKHANSSENLLRNSMSKAILIHTAEDMIDEEGFARSRNQDCFATGNKQKECLVIYGKGPDFATGWGKINAKSALNIIEHGTFEDIEILHNMEKQWLIHVPKGKKNLRTTLAWDDYPSISQSVKKEHYLEKKLVNDLDMYLISPSGKYHYPWRLNPLPTESIDEKGYLNYDVDRHSGLEKIDSADIKSAIRGCDKPNKLDTECFDHLNNVEVVDVDNPEDGLWKIIIRGTHIAYGNGLKDSNAQIASLVTDYSIYESNCEVLHPYMPQNNIECIYNLGDNLENYVTFSEESALGSGDIIYIYDAKDKLLGKYTGSSLAGKRMTLHTNKLKIVLDSDNDGVEGFGYRIKKIESLPYTILPILFKAATE